MRSVALLLLFLTLQDPQGTDVARWIGDLADLELERRELAQRRLIGAGERVLPELQKAIKSNLHAKDPLAGALLETVERTIRESAHDRRERQRELKLVSFPEGDLRVGDVLAQIETCTGFKFDSTIDANRSVRAGGQDQPVRQLFDSIERQLDVTIERAEKPWNTYEVKPGRRARGLRIHVPGATFNVEKFPRVENGQFVGWVVDTTRDGYPDAALQSVEFIGADGKKREQHACRWCSPYRVLVMGTETDELRLRARIGVTWESTYELKVESPGDPQQFRVGDFRVFYEFLKARVESLASAESPLPASVSLEIDLKGGGTCWRGSIGGFMGVG